MNNMVLVGNAKSGTISAFRIEEERLGLVGETFVGEGCATFAIAGDIVYSATKQPEPAILTLRLNREDGTLTELARKPMDDPLAYITAHQGLVLAASYHGGWADAWQVQEDGSLGNAVGQRVTHPNIHCVVADGSDAWFVSLGADLVAHADLSTGRLIEQPQNTVHFPEGSGPRHLIVDGQEAQLVTEFSGEVFHLTRDGGALVIVGKTSITAAGTNLKHSRFGADPKAEHLIWGADVHRAGDFLLASERTESTVASIRDGKQVAISPVEQQPRGFAVSPDSHYAVIAGEASGNVALYRIESDGTLTLCHAVASGEGPNWVRFVEA